MNVVTPLDPEMKKQPPKLPFHLYAVPLPPP